MYAGVQKDKYLHAIQLLNEQIQVIAGGKITQQDVERAINYLGGQMVVATEGLVARSGFYGQEYLLGRRKGGVAEAVHSLNQVTRDQVIDFGLHLLRQTKFVAINGLGNLDFANLVDTLSND